MPCGDPAHVNASVQGAEGSQLNDIWIVWFVPIGGKPPRVSACRIPARPRSRMSK